MSTTPYRLDHLRRDGRLLTRFAHQLTVASGVPVGSRWNPSHSDPARAWQIAWWNGPTVALMRFLAADLAGSVVGVAIEDLQWSRTITPDAFALALITNVRAGRPPLGAHATCGQLMAALEQIDHPQRGTSRDVQLARRLARLGDHLEHGMVAFLQHYGLAGLGEGHLPVQGNLSVLRELQNDDGHNRLRGDSTSA
ncbi:hypothetical protein AB0E69_26285 [Kribbella sp. NPDC026611]|uniref:hypothetical protein n=1 Tax=Kribbella sp. NPDC026611 TaxID=3154911 RepID=UPI0033D9018B